MIHRHLEGQPIPSIQGLEFFEDIHRYRFNGEWVPYSMTQVCKGRNNYFEETKRLPDDNPEKLRLLNAISRGDFVHLQLERFNKGEPYDYGSYGDWVRSCVESDFWDRWEPVPGGVELAVYDPRFKIAGKLDLIVRNKESGMYALCDYKTQSRRDSKPYNIRPQLGGYCNLMDQMPEHRHYGIEKYFAIWVRPGNTEFQPLPSDDCIQQYLAARDVFFSYYPDF